LHERGHDVGLGDEGGFAPNLHAAEEACGPLVEAIASAGYQAERAHVAIALDPAASEFRLEDGRYQHVDGDEPLSATELIGRWAQLAQTFPIWSIEDGLGEDDWDGWKECTDRLGDRLQLVGDDTFVTNPTIIADAIGRGIANSALIKVNQIGTVTETLERPATACEPGGTVAVR
jgi:enolase